MKRALASRWLLLLVLGAAPSWAQPRIDIQDAMLVVEGDSGTVDAVFPLTVSVSDAAGLSTKTLFPFALNFRTRDGSATAADGDFQAVAMGSVMCDETAGACDPIVIKVNGDTRVEGPESFFVDLLPSPPAFLGKTEAVGMIQDDDTTTVSIGDVAVVEGSPGATTSATFSVTLTNPSAFPVTVTFATRDGSATTGDGDYQPAGGQITFAPGSTSQTVVVTVNGDGKVEPDESFFVDLTSPIGASLGDAEGEGRIDNDDQATLSIDDASVLEGDGGATDAIFTVTLSRPSASTVTVDFATRDGTATTGDGDYSPATGRLVFAPGVTAQTVAVSVNGDQVVEPEESFFVDLASPVGATVADGVGQGAIVNDDDASLSIDDETVDEGDDGTTEVTLTVRLSAASAGAVTVDFATRDASATVADGDYRRTSGRLSFPPGVLEQGFAILVNGDRTPEADEVFLVELSNPVGATVTAGRARVTIVNDDIDLDDITLLPPDEFSEGAGAAVVTAVRSGSGRGAASVAVTAAAGTATAGEDFRPRSRVLRWADGETGRRDFEIRLIDDNLQEPRETVVVALGEPTGAELGEPGRVEVVILDDDLPSGLEEVGDLEISAGVGEEVELSVRVVGDDGSPIACALVEWEVVEGEAELVDGPTAKSDADGNAVKTVRLGPAPGTVVVRATPAAALPAARQGAAGDPIVFTITVEGNLDQLFDRTSQPGESSVAGVLDESCGAATGSFAALCDFVFGLADAADRRAVVRELTPREVVAQGDMSLDAMRTQLVNVGNRLAALRGGASRESVDQLALMLGGRPVPVALLASALPAGDDAAGLLDRFDAAVAALDPRQEPGAPAEPAATDPLETPRRWGFFVNGQASFGDSPASELEEGFELETLGLTAGVDYRLSDRLVLGGALGYLDLEAELDRDGGSLESRGTSLSAYASYLREAFYLDAVLTYATNDFDLRRHVDLPQPFLGRSRFTALGAPDGDQLAVALGAGWEAARGASTLGGFGRVSWIDGEVAGYSESGAGPFNLAIRDQEVESLLLEAGAEYTRAISRRWGVLQPTLRASVLRELEDATRLVRGRFVEDVSASEFAVPTDRPDRDYFNFGAGLTAVLARGRSFFVFYDTDLARDDLEVYTLSFGLRLEL